MVELRERDIKTLIGLITEEIDRVAEAREKHGVYDLAYFFHLVDIRNKLLALPSGGELPSTISDEDWAELLKGTGTK